MPRTRSVHGGGKPNLPSVYEIERPGKCEALLNLPQEELKAWLENMALGMRLRENNLQLEYTVGERTYAYEIPIKR